MNPLYIIIPICTLMLCGAIRAVARELETLRVELHRLRGDRHE